jgi:hypothetical protein
MPVSPVSCGIVMTLTPLQHNTFREGKETGAEVGLYLRTQVTSNQE